MYGHSWTPLVSRAIGKNYCLWRKNLRSRLVRKFKHMFLVFKQYYKYFHTFFHPHAFKKKKTKNYHLNTPTKQYLNFGGLKRTLYHVRI